MPYIRKAFDTKWESPLGQNVDEFEESVKAFLCSDGYDCCEVVALSSSALALHYTLKALGVRACDMVCVPSFAPEEIVCEVTKQNAIPVFIGSEADSWNMSHELLEEALDDLWSVAHVRPKAVVMCSAYGMPSVVHRICDVCLRHHVPLIDYAVDAMGSEFYGCRLGIFGQCGYGVVSFDNGAALICEDKTDKERILRLMSKRKGARISNKNAEMGVVQMALLDERIVHQRHVQSLYEELLKDVCGINVHAQPRRDGWEEPLYFDSNYHRTTVLLDRDVDMKKIRKRMADVGVEIQRLYKPLHTYLEFADNPKYTNGICEDLYHRGLCLPSGNFVTDDDVKYIVEQALYKILCK